MIGVLQIYSRDNIGRKHYEIGKTVILKKNELLKCQMPLTGGGGTELIVESKWTTKI